MGGFTGSLHDASGCGWEIANMIRLAIAAWVGLWILPVAGIAQDEKPAPAEKKSPALRAPASQKPAAEKPQDPQPNLAPDADAKPGPAKEELPSGSVVIAEAKIIIRPWNYESDREWDYTLSNARSVAPCGTKMSYEDAYNSITFRRSQYNAQPSYRHDAAMELMFGVMRPTTIVRNSSPTVGPEAPYPYHNDFRRRSSGLSYMYPYNYYPYYYFPHYAY